LLYAIAPVAPALAAAPEPGAGFEVERYELALTPDPAAKSVSGTELIKLRSLTDGLRSLAFSPNALTIDSATVNGRSVGVSSDKEALVFELPLPANKGGAVTLSIGYRGVPKRGVTWTAASMYTSYFACDWMVCLQDSPGDKATFALDLRLPKGMTSLSVGEAKPLGKAADGKVIHRWRSSRPYSPYLFGFATGPFVRAVDESGRGQLVYLGEGTSAAELRRLFAETPAMVRFLSDKAGMGLPDGRYAQLLVPGREAQEAATYSLIGKAELDRSAGDPQSKWIIVHELAHQWWGNLVTSSTWTDFWLNEGITTFMTAAWKEHRFGPVAYEAELDAARTRLARAREAGWDKPLAFAGDYPSIALRRSVQYSKGALFMAHLRTLLGDRAFWAGLKAFTRENAYGTVTSADFQRAMERASRRDLSALFAEWVYDQGDAAAAAQSSSSS
jgi:aminopeptidase N